MARRTGRNRLIASSEATVRYGPQEAALKGLVSQAVSDYGTDVRAAKGEAKEVIRGAKRAIKPTKKTYNLARHTTNVAQADLRTALSTLGAAADPFEAATEREYAGDKRRLAIEKASAVNDLRQRKQEAIGGRAAGKKEARQTYKSTMAKLGEQLVALGDQRGAYEAGRLATLQADAANRRLEKWKTRQSGKTQTDVAKINASDNGGSGSGSGGEGGFDPATRESARLFTADFEKALRYAKRLKGVGWSRADIAEALTTGMKDTGKNRDPNKDIPAIDDQLAISAALDQALDGVLGIKTTKRIKRYGIRPKTLPGAQTRGEEVADRERAVKLGKSGAKSERGYRY